MHQPTRSPLSVLPIWRDCFHCHRFGECEDSFPASGDCPHLYEHELGTRHPTRRWPRYWNWYQKDLQDDQELSSILLRWQLGKPVVEADFLKIREKALAEGISIDCGPRWLLWDLLDDDLAQLHADFVSYYGVEKDKVSYALQAAFTSALIAALPDVVLATTEIGSDWHRYMIDTTRYWLWGLLELQYLDLSQLSDAEFRTTFEQGWEKLLPFRDLAFDFRVIPRLSWEDFVRYQELPKGNKQIRSALSCYVTHQALNYPHLLKTLSSQFTEVAFSRRLHRMYAPLLNVTVRRAAKNLQLGPHQGKEREDIRTTAIKAFQQFSQTFSFYWRPRGAQSSFGECGILGLTEEQAVRREIDQVLKQRGSQLTTQDMAVYAFAHYIKKRMRFWVDTRYPADAHSAPALSLDVPMASNDVGETEDDTLEDTVTDEKFWPLDAEAYVEEDPDVIGPDGTPYMMIRQAARYYGLSEGQLRRMDKAGSFKALRVADVFNPEHCLERSLDGDLRLYSRTPESRQVAEIAKHRARTRSSQLSGRELNRKQAAHYLGVGVQKLRHLEQTEQIRPFRKGTSLVYDESVLAQAAAIFDKREIRGKN